MSAHVSAGGGGKTGRGAGHEHLQSGTHQASVLAPFSVQRLTNQGRNALPGVTDKSSTLDKG